MAGEEGDLAPPEALLHTEIAAQTESERKGILQTLCSAILPELRRMLHKDAAEDSGRDAGAQKSAPKTSKLLRKSYEVGELRPNVAMALVVLLSKLPKPVFDAQVPGLLADLCNALRSRSQDCLRYKN